MTTPPHAEAVPPAVVITGSSTGIGAACALDLDQQGFRVFAGVRTAADRERVRQQGSERLSPVMLDVTNPATVRSAVEEVAATVQQAGLAGLVNNAGIVVGGPLELITRDLFQKQLEVNVIGPLAVTQAFLPLLRLARGRIVSLGSISGRIVPPYLGAYAASKFALEALTDGLRLELRKSGISVSIVEPDSVATPIWDKLDAEARNLASDASPEARPQHEEDLLQMRRTTRRMSRNAMPVDRVVRAVRHALFAKRPRTRYPIGFRTHLAFWAARHLPDRLRDWFLLRELGML